MNKALKITAWTHIWSCGKLVHWRCTTLNKKKKETMQSFFSRVAEAQELDHITHPVEGQCFSQVT